MAINKRSFLELLRGERLFVRWAAMERMKKFGAGVLLWAAVLSPLACGPGEVPREEGSVAEVEGTSASIPFELLEVRLGPEIGRGPNIVELVLSPVPLSKDDAPAIVFLVGDVDLKGSPSEIIVDGARYWLALELPPVGCLDLYDTTGARLKTVEIGDAGCRGIMPASPLPFVVTVDGDTISARRISLLEFADFCLAWGDSEAWVWEGREGERLIETPAFGTIEFLPTPASFRSLPVVTVLRREIFDLETDCHTATVDSIVSISIGFFRWSPPDTLFVIGERDTLRIQRERE